MARLVVISKMRAYLLTMGTELFNSMHQLSSNIDDCASRPKDPHLIGQSTAAPRSGGMKRVRDELLPVAKMLVMLSEAFEGDEHHCPPDGVGPKLSGRELPTGEIIFHDGIGFFALATAVAMPVDEDLAGIEQQ